MIIGVIVILVITINSLAQSTTVFWQEVQTNFILTNKSGMGPINDNYYNWLYDLSREFCKKDIKDAFSKLKNISKEKALQDYVLQVAYRDCNGDINSLNKRLYNLCADDRTATNMAEAVFEKYSGEYRKEKAERANLTFNIPINTHNGLNSDSTYKPSFYETDVKKIMLSATEVDFKKPGNGYGSDQDTKWNISVTQSSVVLTAVNNLGKIVLEYSVMSMAYDYNKQALKLILGTTLEPRSVLSSYPDKTPKHTHDMWIAWGTASNAIEVELMAVDSSEHFWFGNNVTVVGLEKKKTHINEPTRTRIEDDKEYQVIVSKTYLYDNPNLTSKKNGFLLKTWVVVKKKEQGHFFFVKMEEKNGKVTEGWVLKKDLEEYWED